MEGEEGRVKAKLYPNNLSWHLKQHLQEFEFHFSSRMPTFSWTLTFFIKRYYVSTLACESVMFIGKCYKSKILA